jgi:hypothetical protein
MNQLAWAVTPDLEVVSQPNSVWSREELKQRAAAQTKKSH